MGDRSFQSGIPRAEGIDHRAVFFQIVVKFREIRTEFIHVTAALHLRRYGIALFKMVVAATLINVSLMVFCNVPATVSVIFVAMALLF